MWLIQARLTLHDSLFFATREMGTLYETERFIHNYALSYALFNDAVIQVPYFTQSYEPRYREDLGKLNDLGIYVTPARPLQWEYLLVTWKMAQVTYYRRPERFGSTKSPRNFPLNYGRAKELAPGSRFEFFLVSASREVGEHLPRWIRLGKWASKAEVAWERPVEAEPKPATSYTASSPLNPLDVTGRLIAFDLIAMPPVSLVNNALVEGPRYEVEIAGQEVRLPADLRYNIR